MYECTSVDVPSRLLFEKRDRFRCQMRKERTEELFSQFRSKYLPASKKFLSTNITLPFSNEELSSLCQQFRMNYDSKDGAQISYSLKTLKDFLMTIIISAETPSLEEMGIVTPLNEILSNQIDTSGCPDILESALYIYIIFLNQDKGDKNSLVSIDLLANLLGLLTSGQMEDKAFLLFEALAASCVNDYFRDFIIKGDIVRKILDVLMGELWMTDVMLLESMIALLRSLYMIKPAPSFDDTSYLLDPLFVLLVGLTSKEMVVDIMFILSKMAMENHDFFVKSSLQNPDVTQKIIEFLSENNEAYIEAAADLVAGLTFGGCDETYVLFERGVIGSVMGLIEGRKVQGDLLRKCLIVMANFFDGEQRHVEVGLKGSSFFDSLIKSEGEDSKTSMEIINCLVNVTFVASKEQIRELASFGLMKKLAKALEGIENDGDFIISVLQGLENMMKHGEKDKKVDLKPKIERLLSHYNENVAFCAGKFIEEYMKN